MGRKVLAGAHVKAQWEERWERLGEDSRGTLLDLVTTPERERVGEVSGWGATPGDTREWEASAAGVYLGTFSSRRLAKCAVELAASGSTLDPNRKPWNRYRQRRLCFPWPRNERDAARAKEGLRLRREQGR